MNGVVGRFIVGLGVGAFCWSSYGSQCVVDKTAGWPMAPVPTKWGKVEPGQVEVRPGFFVSKSEARLYVPWFDTLEQAGLSAKKAVEYRDFVEEQVPYNGNFKNEVENSPLIGRLEVLLSAFEMKECTMEDAIAQAEDRYKKKVKDIKSLDDFVTLLRALMSQKRCYHEARLYLDDGVAEEDVIYSPGRAEAGESMYETIYGMAYVDGVELWLNKKK
ncbi:MAG: hypothetical protein LBF84_02905 [Holosporales bacterium]|jgi:hypothetical protein|nr:hypothetical protein [Holosporales bacterium]